METGPSQWPDVGPFPARAFHVVDSVIGVTAGKDGFMPGLSIAMPAEGNLPSRALSHRLIIKSVTGLENPGPAGIVDELPDGVPVPA